MNSIAARMVYENSLKALSDAFPGQSLTSFKTTQSFLRLEMALATTKAGYQFQVTGAATFNTEQRLSIQDSFVVSEIGVFVGLPAGSTSALFELDTYCNATKYTNGAAMNAVYNAVLSIAVGTETVLPAWDVTRHFYRPTTQLTGATNTPSDQKRLAEDGFYPTEPNIILSGNKNNIVSINLQNALTAVDANSRLIVIFRGLLAQNSTPIS